LLKWWDQWWDKFQQFQREADEANHRRDGRSFETP